MISIEKHFLFVHVPKTGGNSIQERLKAYSEDRIVSVAPHQDGIERFEVRSTKYPTVKHSSLSDYERVLEPELFPTLFKFATIRNPWDKLISFYFSPHRGSPSWDRESFKEFVNTVEPLRSYIASGSWRERLRQGMGRGLLQRLSTPLDAHVDFIMRFEDLNADFRTVCARLDIPYSPLPKRNRSERLPYHAYYDGELIEIVAGRFREEIDYGSYSFEAIAPSSGTSGPR
jgi:hypothetical protein